MLVEQLRYNRDALYSRIRTSPVLRDRLRVYQGTGGCGGQAATYLAWIDCSGIFGEGKAKPGQVEALFREHKVGLSEGGYFGLNGEGRDHVRLNFGCPVRLPRSLLARL
jgi:bifunctional pyridoxal-dependent enzyme with beta-cystathionase and maltose regulon repressor activities